MPTQFRDASGQERLLGTIYAPGATPGDVFTVQADGSLAPSPGGGSQPVEVVRVPVAFDTPNFQSRTFAIFGVDQGTKTFTLTADYSAFFAPGDVITVFGSTGNDGTYTVASLDVVDVVVVEAIPDATADGNVTAAGTVGVPIYTPSIGDIFLFFGFSVTTEFIGQTPTLQLGYPDFGNEILSAPGSPVDNASSHLSHTNSGNSDPLNFQKINYFTDTDPVLAVLDNASGLYPVATEGEGVVLALILKASA